VLLHLIILERCKQETDLQQNISNNREMSLIAIHIYPSVVYVLIVLFEKSASYKKAAAKQKALQQLLGFFLCVKHWVRSKE
jgi:hypothetical protein